VGVPAALAGAAAPTLNTAAATAVSGRSRRNLMGVLSAKIGTGIGIRARADSVRRR
jgi:hypothetical protein